MRRPVVLLPLALVFGVAATGTAPDERAHRAWVDYALHCQGCHLPDGRGMAGKVPDMRGQLGHFAALPGGREYLVRVPGVSTARLGDADVARLMNWLVRRMGPVPAGFEDYTTEEVARLRADWLRSPGPVRRQLKAAMAGATVQAR